MVCIRGKRLVHAFAALLLPLLFTFSVVAEDWAIEVIDSNQGGRSSTLVIDAHGNAHVAYSDPVQSQLRYAFWDKSQNRWFAMTVDRASDAFVSMALDSKQWPHIASLEYGTGRLKYSHWNGQSWATQVLALSSRRLEYYVSIAIDANDRPVLTYYEVNGTDMAVLSLKLRSVAWNGSNWEIRTIDGTSGSGKFNYIAPHSDGRMSVAYANVRDENADLRYAMWDGKEWKPEILLQSQDKLHIRSVAIAVDRNDNPHIAFSTAATHDLKYATRRGNRWEFENVDHFVREGYPDRNGIAVDRHGTPYISASDVGARMLKVWCRVGGKWVGEIVESGSSAFTSSIQVSEREIIVTYYDADSNSLKCARRPLGISSSAERTERVHGR
jgi:hypothetical protein